MSELLDADEEEAIFGLGGTGTGSADVVVMNIHDTANVMYASFDYHSGAAFVQAAISTTALTVGTWHRIDIEYNQSGADGTDILKCWVDGTLEVNLTNLTYDRTADTIHIGATTGWSTGDDSVVQIDNFKADDDTMPSACPT